VRPYTRLLGDFRYVPSPVPPPYTCTMSTKPASRIVCAQCEQSESRCWCEKFCILCQSQLDIRLCTDGLMYCEPCRTACDYKPIET
jgi:hypothetical protein